MNCSTILRGVIVPLMMMAALCLAGVARPASARTPEKTGTDEQETKAANTPTSATEELVPLEIKLPHILSHKIRKNPGSIDFVRRPPFMVPKGVRLLSFHKKVIASCEPILGEVAFVNDGNKEDLDGDYLELEPGVQWVQIDLGEPCDVYAIVIWHHHLYEPIYHDVILRSADEPDFKRGVRTLFNNDFDNSAKLGKGTDQEYVETGQGKLIDGKDKQGKPVRTRYLRCTSNGNNFSDLNAYVEVEVYGRPLGKAKK